MRSQIACAHCRRSKVKCVNTGTDSVCRACQNQNRECTYPEAGSSGPRRESTVGEALRVKREKKRALPSSQPLYPNKKQTPPVQVAENALDPQVLTPQVWNELFDIFQQHFATELPFLHAPTFRNEVQKLPPLLSLAFLALTARFHPTLVGLHDGPVKAAEYYAKAAHASLTTRDHLDRATIKTTQALLMLGLHEWGMARGPKAWRLIGDAIRCAQALGLHIDPALDDELNATASALRDPDRAEPHSEKQRIIYNEIDRRIFWSCFIMDRYLSFGKQRPPTYVKEALRVRLPCSDHAFIFGHDVNTMMLSESIDQAKARFQAERELKRTGKPLDQKNETSVNGTFGQRMTEIEPREETGDNEGILSRFIRSIDLLGQVLKWACTGGRRRRQDYHLAPWNPQSMFYKLEEQLNTLKRALPQDHVLNVHNTQCHIEANTSRHYTLMHTGHLLCSIALYREYMCFLPYTLEKPEGPLDEPTLPESKYPLPYTSYWEDQARACFSAARGLVDLLHACEENHVMVETPFSGFAIWQAVICGIYCDQFPKMDVDSSLTSKDPTRSDPSGKIAFRTSLRMFRDITKRLFIARSWHVAMGVMSEKIRNTRASWQKNPAVLKGGGLNVYVELESLVKDYLDYDIDQDVNEDVKMPDYSPEPSQGTSRGSGNDLPKHEPQDLTNWNERADGMHGTAPPGEWTSVNAAKAETENNALRVSNSTQHHFGPQLPSHASQANMASSPEAYPSHGSAFGEQHPTPRPRLMPAESVHRSSHDNTHHAQDRSHVIVQCQPLQEFPRAMINASFQAGFDWLAFSAGENVQDWKSAPQVEPPTGWFPALWDVSRYPRSLAEQTRVTG